MYELSKSRLQSHSLMEIGIDFRYGYEIAPLQCIQQVLWFHLETNCANTSRVPSQTHYWIEYASGAVALLRLNDLECSPERFLSSLADLNPDDCDDHTLTDRLQRNWLIPPEFRVVSIPAALLYPNRAFIWQAVKEQLSAMLGMPNLAAPLSQRIQQFLDACQREMYEHHGGVIVERYAITPHHEASPSIDCLDGISEFLALAQDFRDRLYPDILGLFDDYAPLLDARTHTIDNYNTARRWSDTQRRNRIQAIRSFPWLFHELGLRTGGPGYYHEPAEITVNKQASIVAAIDLGQPLLPLLATCYNVGKHTLRYARGFLKSRYCLPSTIPVILWLLDCGISST